MAHNREVVLSTAREVFAERGYGAATLDQIAEAAGFSKGVVYSQFDSKADLFLTVLERRVEERAAQNRRSVEDLDGSIELDQLVEGFVESMLGNDPAWRLAVIEVRVAAARDEALLDRYRQVHARTVDQLAEVMTDVLERVGIEPVVPPVVIASALLAMDVGITLEAAASPGVLGRRELVTLIRQMIFGAARTVHAAATEGAVMREQTADDWTVGRHLTALLAAAPESIDRLSWSREQINAHQEAAMRRLLAHAVEHSGFHARRLGGVDIDGWRLADLAALPVMTKRDMMGAFDSVLTDPSVTKQRADDHLAAHGQSLAYLDGRYLVITSGGSSGERGVFVWGVEAFTAYTLSTARRTMAKVASLGVTRDNPVSGALVAAGSPIHATAIVGQLIGGPGAAVTMTAIPATLPFDEIVHRLNDLQPLVLVGYPSVLVRLADARRSGRLSIAPLAVSATSEPLPTPMRRSIEEAFGVQVTNTFGSSEGLCGVSEPGSDAICFAEDTCIVELVDADNRPVGPGEFADKVLVTNLVNHVQPLIRYELTDRFQQVPGEWPDGYLRARSRDATTNHCDGAPPRFTRSSWGAPCSSTPRCSNTRSTKPRPESPSTSSPPTSSTRLRPRPACGTRCARPASTMPPSSCSE